MEINTTYIMLAIIGTGLGGSGMLGLFFWFYKRNALKADQALADVLTKIDKRLEEHGKRLHEIETAGLVTGKDMEARLGPLDNQLREMVTATATMKGHMEGMATMAKNLIKNGG